MRSSHLPFKFSSLLISFILLFSAQSIFAQSGWQSTFSNNVFIINKIIKRDSLNFFAFSNDSKYLLKSTDGGTSWLNLQSSILDTACIINDGKFITPEIGWIVGWYKNGLDGAIIKTTNGGLNWVRQNPGILHYWCKSISVINENVIYVSSNQQFLTTTNGGINWTSRPWSSYGFTTNIDKVRFYNENTGWIIGYGGILAKTTNAGQNWVRDINFNGHNLIDFSIINANEYWVLSKVGSLQSAFYKTTNGGVDWNLMGYRSSTLAEMKFFTPYIGYIYGGNVLFKTESAGQTWDSIYVSSSQPVNTVLPVDMDIILAGGGRTKGSFEPPNTYVNIVKSSNSGVSWTEKFNNRNYNFAGVHFKDNLNGLAIEEKGMILRTTNAGVNWLKIFDSTAYSFTIIKSLNDTNLLVFANNGKILRTNNYGQTWSEIPTPLNYAKVKINFFNELTGYAMGMGKQIQKTTNGGLNWDNMIIPFTQEEFTYGVGGCSDISFINENTGWISGAASWYHPGGANQGFTAYASTILRTTNGGINWNAVYNYSSTSGYSSYLRINFFSQNEGWSWKGSTVFRTTDGGISWANYSQYQNFTFHWVYMLNSSTGWATGFYGTYNAVSKTTNAGLNWILQFNSPVRIINPVFILDENNAWFGGADNVIYKTTNGGGEIISAINPITTNIPEGFLLKQNYPNPFNPTTKINFDLKNTAFAMLRVYDITGREVRTLVNEKLSAGSYSYDFNASELPSGVYFYQLQTDDFIETKKMILLK